MAVPPLPGNACALTNAVDGLPGFSVFQRRGLRVPDAPSAALRRILHRTIRIVKLLVFAVSIRRALR
ncbi:MAG TPA: hypothetical protein VIO16_12260, partial [Dehalococcoidia bacterium]